MADIAMPSVEPAADVTVKKEEEDTQLPVKSELTPPASDRPEQNAETSSELSEAPAIDELPDAVEDDIGEIEPDHYWDGGKIPVFKPTWKQFKDFKVFIDRVDKYGMKSGIVKVIPPKEWTDSLPQLDEHVKTIKVKNPITQMFNGTQGTYTQGNQERARSYNLPQWKALTQESSHQPPAKRGERRREHAKPVRKAPSTPAAPRDGKKRGPGRPRTRPRPSAEPIVKEEENDAKEAETPNVQSSPVPPTPTSTDAPVDSAASTPTPTPTKGKKKGAAKGGRSGTPKAKAGEQKSVNSRRLRNKNEQNDVIDEEAFKDFNYRLEDNDQWTKERCQELEAQYWKSLNFNDPLYGADMPGSLFEDKTTSWNVAKLPNLLDVLNQKVPGVNTAYLYLGMWKATFAWHLEDVDLYSINYIHFGAPKQWYSISQEDARKFERAMKTEFPQDAKHCDQFLRHKTYLVSPQKLKSQYGIQVNRLVHYEGEFVITYPYGYHSGYNIGYNCAESVNFATESWLEYGKIARKCNCEEDSVWIDVYDIERKLRGEPTPEYEEYIEYSDLDDDDSTNLPTPPASDKGASKRAGKRKAGDGDADKKGAKRVRLTLKTPRKSLCALCPNDLPEFVQDLLPTEDGRQAHRICALLIPETYLTGPEGSETVCGINDIDRQRLALRCIFCRKTNGAAFQCSAKKCARAYHATCAAPGGVLVEIGPEARYAPDGTEYADVGIDFRCRFHRQRRPKFPNEIALRDALEADEVVQKYAKGVQRGEVVQWKYLSGDILAGYVMENRVDEGMILVETVPQRRKVEIEHSYLLALDKAHSQLTPPSANAKPLPAHLSRNSQTSAEKPPNEDEPQPESAFNGDDQPYKWAEFRSERIDRNPDQAQIDLARHKQVWLYMGRNSTEAKACYTADPAVREHDPAADFLRSAGTSRPRPTQTKPPKPKADDKSVVPAKPALATTTTATTLGPAPRRPVFDAVHYPSTVAALDILYRSSSNSQPGLKPFPAAPAPGGSALARPVAKPNEKPTLKATGQKSNTNLSFPLHGVRVDQEALRNQQAFVANPERHAHPANNSGGARSLTSASASNIPSHSVTASLPSSSAAASAATASSPSQSSSQTHQFSPPPNKPSPAVPRPPGRKKSRSISTSAALSSTAHMPDISRRRSELAPGLNVEEIRKMSQGGHFPYQVNSRPSSSSQHQAPVAPMLSANSPTTQSTYSRPSTSHHTPPSTCNSSVGSRDRSDSFKALAKYPYLYEAALARPPVYRSPYGPPGIVTDSWLPNPSKALRPRSSSLTQEYLKARTPSQREAVKGHVRTISTEKAQGQAAEAERRQRDYLQRMKHLSAQSPVFGSGGFGGDMFSSRGFTPFNDFAGVNGSSSSAAFAPLQPSLFSNPASPVFGPPNSNVGGFGGSALSHVSPFSFSSPQDFQLQMQTDLPSHNLHDPMVTATSDSRPKPQLMAHGRTSYGALKRRLDEGGAFPEGFIGPLPYGSAGQGSGYGHHSNSDGTSGSPIRSGRGSAGGEMLPMMQDHTF